MIPKIQVSTPLHYINFYQVLKFKFLSFLLDPAKQELLCEDDLTRTNLGDRQRLVSECALIDPDDPIVTEDGADDNNDNEEDDESEYFNNADDEDENEEDEEGNGNLNTELKDQPRQRHLKGAKTKTYSCSVVGCPKTYTALHHLKV